MLTQSNTSNDVAHSGAITVSNGPAPGAFTLSNQAPVCDQTPPVGPAVQLNWTASSGATSYQVYRNGSAVGAPTTGTSFYNNLGLVAGQVYTYFIRASSASWTTDSNAITVTVPAAICAPLPQPGGFVLSNQPPLCGSKATGPAVQLGWTASAGATSYDVYRDGLQIASSLSSATLVFSDSFGLSPGKTYAYLIRAHNSGGTTDSNTISISIAASICSASAPPPPFTLSNQAPTCDYTPPAGPGVQLVWTPSSGASSYEVYRDGNKIFPVSSTLTATSFYNVSGLNPGQAYAYFIRARNDAGTTDSNAISVSVPANVCPVSRPPDAVSLTATAACNPADSQSPGGPATRLVWTSSATASAYDLVRDGIHLQANLPTTITGYFDTSGLRAGNNNRYTVTARNSAGGTDSNAVTIPASSACVPPSPVTLSGVAGCAQSSPAMSLSWNASSVATGYDLYKNGVLLAQGLPSTANAFSDTDHLIAGQLYTYLINASDAYGSTQSNTVPLTALATCSSPSQTGTEADLSIAGSFKPDSVQRNSEVVLTLSIKNNGPASASDVVVTLPTPSGSTFQSATLSSGTTPVTSVTQTGTIRIALGRIPAGTSIGISATYYVYAEPGALLSTSPTVGASTVDPTPANQSVSVSVAVLNGLGASTVEQLIDHAQSLIQGPLPQFQGNWFADVVENLFGDNAYQNLYLKGVNALNVAANVLSSAKRFYWENDLNNANKYALLAIEYKQDSDQSFALADDVYYGRLTAVQDTGYTVYKITSPSLTALQALGCGAPCGALQHAADFAVDNTMSGFGDAVKNQVEDLVIGKMLDEAGLSPDVLLKGTNQWLGNSEIYEKLLAWTANPDADKQLMSIFAATADLTEASAHDYVQNFLESLADQAAAPVYIAPGQTTNPTAPQGNARPARVGRDGSRVAAADVTTGSWPTIYSTGVVNVASYAGSGVSPGEIVAVFGSGLGPKIPVSLQIADDGTVSKSIGGVRLLFDSVPAPLVYVSDGQINAVVPYEVAGRDSTRVQVEYGGVRSFPVEIPVVPSQPGVFSSDASGHGLGAIVNEDGTINSLTNPAAKGSIISLYETGEGQTEPWGVSVDNVEIRDVGLPEQMQRAMARQAEAERERRAKGIAAQGEFESSGGFPPLILRSHYFLFASSSVDCPLKLFTLVAPRLLSRVSCRSMYASRRIRLAGVQSLY